MSAPLDKRRQLGSPVGSGPGHWVQTDRKAHEAWSKLTMRSPRAAAVMHRLVAMMGHQNAVVISMKTLAKSMLCNERTVRRAIDDLVDDRWIQRVQLGQRGTCNAFVVNAAVAWGEKREHIGRLAVFHASVVADEGDQVGEIAQTQLRKLPVIYPPEQAMPDGDGEPGGQPALPGFEPVIPGNAQRDGPMLVEVLERALEALESGEEDA